MESKLHKFKVLVNGGNFLINMDEKDQGKYGFYQTLYLEAVSVEKVELMAV